MLSFTTYSSEETKALGAVLAQAAKEEMPSKALVIALDGDLGAGKTTFIQGFFRGLGLKRSPMSPTFILMRRTAIRAGHFRNVYHMDAYRLKEAGELKALDFDLIKSDPRNIILVEWANNIKKALPKDSVRIKIRHGRNENGRTLIFS